MNLLLLEKFLLWSIILNLGCAVLILIAMVGFKKKIYAIHSKIYNIPVEEVAKAMYKSLTFYKTIFVFFNVIPYIAILIIK